ncbi:MAG: hypothetical protein KF760_34535 [Candidatus Eremiobacteraeota bacterium]|nr:hypothetical protein [Candidatus Eremiobacteraeota bacterium]MCW5868712.1 hypothetical protein [Candidatus Eremiobacteraeota bacterium]
MRRHTRGIALITTLLLLTIMTMMLSSSIIRTFGESILGRGNSSMTSAQYAAESGLSLAMSRLAVNHAFASNITGTMSNGATYLVDFGPGASVNNLGADTAQSGPRGPGTVAARSAYLVVYGRHGERVRRIEAVVKEGLPRLPLRSAILASGNITLVGDVQIGGVTSLEDATPVSADLVSNSASNQAGQIQWIASGGSANIDGSIRTVSTSGSSIQATGANVSQGLKPGSNSQEMPHPDILGRISSHSSATALVTTPGLTVVSSGDHYHSGNLNYNGDLELDQSNLYVNGSVNVTGSIKGTGSLFVAGNTTLHGDAAMQAAAGQQVSLLSHGSVSLQGYDGSEYMASLDPAATTVLQTSLSLLQTGLASGDPSPYFNNGIYDTVPADIRASVTSLRSALAAEPASPRKDFLNKRLDLLSNSSNSGMFDWPLGGDSGPGVKPQDAVLDAFLADGKSHGGLFDAFNDRLCQRPASEKVAIMNRMNQMLGGLNYKSPGSAVFVGQVYTNGFVYAENDMNILGSLQAMDDSSQLPSMPDGTTTVRPGELYLKKRTSVTFVQSQSEAVGSTVGTMALKMIIQE